MILGDPGGPHIVTGILKRERRRQGRQKEM